MSAVRMVAYGVLELKPLLDTDPHWLENVGGISQAQENEQIRKLVREELERYGLALCKHLTTYRAWGRDKIRGEYTLYGQKWGSPGFQTRAPLWVGSFKECCIEAAKLLDQLDQAQVPDTAAGD